MHRRSAECRLEPCYPQIISPIWIKVAYHPAAAVIHVHRHAKKHLFAVAAAFEVYGTSFGAGQGRQKQGRKNGYNGDHHQQFDQGKARRSSDAGCPAAILNRFHHPGHFIQANLV